MDSLTLLSNERYWTCFPSQPSFPFYPRVEWFTGSLALLSGVLVDHVPSLAYLYPSLLPLIAFRAWVCWREEEEVVSLPSQLPFAVSIRKDMEALLPFNSPGISLKLSSEGLWRFTFVVCIHTKDPQWSSFLPFGLKQIFVLTEFVHFQHLHLGLTTYCPRQTPYLTLSSEWDTPVVHLVFGARSKNPSAFPSPHITKLKEEF